MFYNFTLTTAQDIFTVAPKEDDKKMKSRKVREDFRRTPNPYLLFCKERRTQLHKENPDAQSRDITKVLAEEWKSMREDEKESYKIKYKKLLENEKYEERRNKKNKEISVSHLLGKWTLNIETESGAKIAIPALISQIFE